MITSASGPASWIDEETGIEEVATFIGPTGSRMLVFVHLPTGSPGGAVVVCAPPGRAHLNTYRKSVMLARALARQGLVGVRFHSRGTGNSDPLPGGAVSLDSIERDALEVTEWVRATTGAERFGFVGEGLSSFSAARACRRTGPGPLVLIDPTAAAASQYRQLFRSLRVAQTRSGQQGAATARRMLQEQGWADLFGYRLEASAFEADSQHDLLDDLGAEPRSVLVIQLERRSDLRPELQELVSRWEDLGMEVESAPIQVPAPWLVPDWEPEEEEQENFEVVARAGAWLAQRMAR